MQMNLNNIEFHNFAEVTQTSEFHGVALYRFPENIRNLTGSRTPNCGEIRFVSNAPSIQVALGFLSTSGQNEKQTFIRVFQGNFERELPPGFSLENGKTTILSLSSKTMLDRMNFEEMHQQTVLDTMRKNALPSDGFAPNVWRIMFHETPTVYFCGIDTHGYACRKPNADEKPKIKFLSIGGSTTQFGMDVWSATAARRLRMDHWNFGMSGANVWQDGYADYIASIDHFDLIAFMFGMNVLPYTPGEEIRRRMRNMLTRLTEKNPDRPIVGIPTYPCNLDRLIDPEADPFYHPYLEMKKIFQETMDEFSAKANVQLIQGAELMDDPCGLYCDGLHMSTYSQVLMGINLAERLRNLPMFQ